MLPREIQLVRCPARRLATSAFEVWACAPLTATLLLLFVLRTSSQIFPTGFDTHTDSADWHRSWFGVLDVCVCFAVLLGIAKSTLRPPASALWYCLVFLFSAVGSLLPLYAQEASVAGDLLLHAARMVACFLFGAALARQFGISSAINLLYVTYCLLCISALFVSSMMLPAFHRMFASAMTVASFAQLSAIVSLFAIHLRHLKIAAVALSFLVLTFSLTSVIALILCLLLSPPQAITRDGPAMHLSRPTFRSRAYTFAALGVFLALCMVINMHSDRGFNTRIDDAMTLHGRVEIWQHGIELLQGFAQGWLGVGFGRAPCFLRLVNFAGPGEQPLYYSQFHSIILESLISMGLLAMPLFYLFAHFLVRSYKNNLNLEAAVGTFFAITQSVDFTLYRPKEEALFSFVLGLIAASALSRTLPDPSLSEPLSSSACLPLANDTLKGPAKPAHLKRL